MSFTILADRDRWGPSGLFGGQAAPPARYLLDPDTAPQVVSSKTTLSLQPGDVISIQSCGGGGYGPPEARDPAAVLRDVLDVADHAPARAADAYRVAVDVATRHGRRGWRPPRSARVGPRWATGSGSTSAARSPTRS